ncbi:MAG: DUF3857 domain-containing protein [Polyangiaceae bacterium]
MKDRHCSNGAFLGTAHRCPKPQRFALTVGTLALALFSGGAARAEWFHPDLERAAAEVESAKGPEAYAALRRVWSTWDRANPDQVEQVLGLASENPKLTPSARAYAAMLVAYARGRRGDLTANRKQLRELGFVDRWLVVGPFDNEGKAGLAQAFQPETEFSSEIVLGRAYSGKERPVRWREAPNVFSYGFVDLGSLLRPEQKACGYLTSFVKSKAGKPKQLSTWVGASGAFKLFWNGNQVLEDTAYRGHDAERFATRVKLEPGFNNLTIKVCGEASAPAATVRLGDAAGKPDADLEFSNSVEHSKLAAKNASKKVEVIAPTGPIGAVQAFEKTIAGKKPSAAALYAYADYLVETGGDDPKEHWARDYALRAAEQEPTVKRLLLAGDLSEDRNKYAAWVKKAEALAKPDDVDVLLARARLARSSPAWRDAIPFYDKVLALDPDNLEGLEGRIELYNEAGLKRTALEALERAVEKSPESVTLLNMYASQLRALGRATEAEEVESRYAARRFDDRSYLGQKVDLAVTRRNSRAAQHWTSRLLEADGDSLWAYAVSAQTQRMLGQPQRAVAEYKRALDLTPEDVGTLRALADLHAETGNREEQLALLRQILQIRPQEQDVREYVEHIEPPKPRSDEAYAWASARFLKDRLARPKGQNKRTLVDLTVTTVYDNGLSSQFRQVVFQPLTDSAAATSRQFGFAYQADSQRVQLRGAKVYRADGSVDEAIESGEAAADDPSIAMYTSSRSYYVQFPRLEPGDVVELKYRIDDVTPVNEFADYFGAVEYLQSSEPIGHAEYVLIAPKKRKLYIDTVRLPGLKKSQETKGDQQIYRFAMEKVPAIVPEPAMPPWPEVLGFVHVSTFKDYKAMGTWYWGLAKDQFDLDDETRKLVHDITKGKTTTLDKVKAVYDWVIENTRYVALEFGIYGFKPRRCVQTVARGWGDCKDKATVIVSMLKELGINSTIVILRTGLRGDFASQVASLAPFDHAIAYVPELDLYLDGTAEFTGSTELPAMDLGALGLLVNQGDSKLVHLPQIDPKAAVDTRDITAVVDADGSAKLELAYETRGTGASSWRRRYHAEATRRARVQRDLGQEFPGIEIDEGKAGIVANDLEDVEQPVSMKIKGKAPSFARVEGKRLSMAVTSNYRLTPSFASLSSRKLDVRLPALGTSKNTFSVKLPAGMKVVALPSAKSGKSKFGSFELQVQQVGGEVKVTSTLVIDVARVKSSEYAEWKKFCTEVDSAFAQRLVVEK